MQVGRFLSVHCVLLIISSQIKLTTRIHFVYTCNNIEKLTLKIHIITEMLLKVVLNTIAIYYYILKCRVEFSSSSFTCLFLIL